MLHELSKVREGTMQGWPSVMCHRGWLQVPEIPFRDKSLPCVNHPRGQPWGISRVGRNSAIVHSTWSLMFLLTLCLAAVCLQVLVARSSVSSPSVHAYLQDGGPRILQDALIGKLEASILNTRSSPSFTRAWLTCGNRKTVGGTVVI